jgi:hypothetical protein
VSDPILFTPVRASTGLRGATHQSGIIDGPLGDSDLFFTDDDIDDLWLAFMGGCEWIEWLVLCPVCAQKTQRRVGTCADP